MGIRTIALCTAAILGLGASQSQAAIMRIDMTPGGAVDATRVQAPGDLFDVNILIDGVPDLAGFQFEVTFDGGILEAAAVVSGGIFGADTFPVASGIAPGSVVFAETTLAPTGVDASASVLLATVRFGVLAEGISPLALANVVLSDGAGSGIALDGVTGGSLVARASPGVVPEPASLLLVSVGLGGLLSRRRRRG